MADVSGKFFSAKKVRTGVSPSSPGVEQGETLPPVNPPGTSINSVGLTMPSAFAVANSPLTSNGTIAVTGAGTVGQYVRGDGSLADFPESSGGGASVSYYLNGSVAQGTIGGVAYREMNKVPILGAGTDFTINANGYIASFITDAGDPNLLEIPGGNWNFETYFSASSGGGTPTFYVELYKVNSGGTATLIASNSSNPEFIAFGTNITAYFTSLAVPTTTLALTDRLAVRYYVTHSGRTITMHTEGTHLCQIITTFTTGLTALNGLTAQVQNFAVGTTGTDFNIASAIATHTFNLPTASAANRGALSAADWTTFNNKENAITAGTTAQYFRGDKTFQTLNTAAVPELTNLYYTEARVSANTDVAANTAARHNAVTLGTANGLSLSTQQLSLGLASAGVTGALSGTDWSTFNSKQQALNGTGFVKISGTTISYDNSTYYLASNPSAFIALTALSGTAPIQYNNTTGVISITQSSGSTNGFLSSTDWTTFNNKQNALTNPVTGTGSAGQVAFWNGTTTQTGDSKLTFNSSTGLLTLDGDLTFTGPQTIQTSTGNLTLATGGANGNILLTPQGSGKVGIGTVTPDAQLQVSTTDNLIANFQNTRNGATQLFFGNDFNFDATNFTNYSTTLFFRGDKQNRYTSTGVVIGPLASIATIYDNTTFSSDTQQGAGALVFSTRQGTATTASDTITERWRIGSTGILQSNGAQTIQTSTGNLTIATAAGNGNILLSPNGTGTVLINTTTSVTNRELIVNNIEDNNYLRIISGVPSSVSSTSHLELISSFSGSGVVGTALISSSAPAGGQSILTFSTSASANTPTERWSILSSGILQSNAAQTIQTSTGNLTIATAAGNGNILLSPNGTGNVGIGTATPSSELEISQSSTGNLDYLTIHNTGGGAVNDQTALSFEHGGTRRSSKVFSTLENSTNTALGFVTTFSSVETERWRITSAGILQSNAAQTIQTSTGNLTLATAAGNGNILLRPNGTGNVGINTATPATRLHIVGGGTTTSASDFATTVTQRIDVANAAISLGFGYVANDFAMIQSINNVTSTARALTINPFGGNVLINTTTSSTFALDVNGTARLSGNLTVGQTTYLAGTYSLDVTTSGIAGISEVARFAANGNGGTNRGAGIVISAAGSASTLSVARLVGYQETTSATANNASFAIQVANSSGTLTEYLRINNIGGVGIGSSTIVASARLQVDSTTQGFLPPRMTTTQRNAIASPATGLVVYDTTLNDPFYYNGTAWTMFQDGITLTTTGTSGAATLVGTTLNIPQYQAALTNPVTGTGTSGQVAYFNGTSSITGESNLFWDSTNDRLGIATNSPLHRLQITQAVDGSYPTLGTGKGALFVAGDTNLYGLYLGINTTDGNSWFQAMRNNTATAYNIVLNPVGGKVLIGTTADLGFTLDVNGTGRFSSSLNGTFIGSTLSNTSNGTGARNVLLFTNSVGGNGQIELFGGGYTPSGGGDDVADGFRLFSNGSGGMAIRANTGTLRFYTGSTERLSIASTGAATFSSTLDTGGRITITADAGNEQFIIKRASNTNEQLIFGFHSSDYAKIQAVEQGVAFRPLALNQDGGNVLIGTTTDNGSRLRVNGSLALPHTTKSANYTLDNTDYTVGFDCASNRTATLPDATTCAGRIYVIYQYNTNVGIRYVTLDGNGSQTIDGLTTYSLMGYLDFTSVMIQSNGSNWIVIADKLYPAPV